MFSFRTRLKQLAAAMGLATVLSGCAAVGEQSSGLREPFAELPEGPSEESRRSRLSGVSPESRQIERNLGIR